LKERLRKSRSSNKKRIKQKEKKEELKHSDVICFTQLIKFPEPAPARRSQLQFEVGGKREGKLPGVQVAQTVEPARGGMHVSGSE